MMPTSSFRPVLHAQDAQIFDPTLLGGKAANLAFLTRHGYAVPKWLVVPSDVFSHVLAQTGLDLRIRERLRGVNWEDPTSIKAASDDIAQWVRDLPVEQPLTDEIVATYQAAFSADALVAVRSSAVGEDSADASFAGQMDTFLFVKGADGVLACLKGCWASAFSERALAYRDRQGLSTDDIRIAVIIQEMVFGDVSGVLFTANPVNGRYSEAVVSSVYGIGEGLVSGELDADHWVWRYGAEKPITERTIVTKTDQIVFDEVQGFGTTKRVVSPDKQEQPSLTDDQIRQLVEIGEKIAALYGSPQDIEWALKEDTIYVLQARPITTLKPPPLGKKRLWDNSNIAESYHGVTTPLTFSFVNRMYEVAYQVMFDAFGIPQETLRKNHHVFANLLGLLNGRLYYNLGNYYQIITFLPAYEYMKEFFDTMIGVQEKQEYDRKRASLAEKLFVGVPKVAYLVGRITGCFFSWDKDVDRFNRHFTQFFEAYRKKPYALMDADSILDAYRELEEELLWKWQAPMINDFFAMLFYGLLKRLTASWQLDESGSLQNDLLCGEGGLESTMPAKELVRLALTVRNDDGLKQLFQSSPESEIREALNQPRFLAFKKELDGYLDRFGYRCMGELKLESRTLQEDPTFVFTMLKNYLIVPHLDLAEMEAEERLVRERAEAKVRSKFRFSPIRALLFGWVLANARKGVRNRENLRMARTRAFGLVREIFRGLGQQLVKMGELDQVEDVFYLDFADLFAFVEGRATCTDLRGLVQLRRKEFARYQDAEADDRLETIGAVYYGSQLVSEEDTGADGGDPNLLKGTPCCPGDIRGQARVILSPTDDMRLNGEILVTERTDPGWVPLYPSVSGLLIERGSLLSHAAVVAREMGLPTVIGVKGLIKKVKDGQWLEVDGRQGTVRLLSDEP